MTAYETMAANAKFEQECFEAAKRELEKSANSPIDFAIRLIQRAQEIKQERRGEK